MRACRTVHHCFAPVASTSLVPSRNSKKKHRIPSHVERDAVFFLLRNQQWLSPSSLFSRSLLLTLCCRRRLLLLRGCLLLRGSRLLRALSCTGKGGHRSGRHRINVGSIVLAYRLHEEARCHAEHNQESSQSPCGFLHKICRLAYAEHRIGTGNVRSQTAAFGFLDENHNGQQDSRNHGEDN